MKSVLRIFIILSMIGILCTVILVIGLLHLSALNELELDGLVIVSIIEIIIGILDGINFLKFVSYIK